MEFFLTMVLITLIIAVITVVDNFDSRPATMSREAASQIAMERTARFSTAYSDSPESITRTLSAMRAFEGAINEEKCANLRKEYRGWIKFRRGRAVENLKDAEKRRKIAKERSVLGR